MTDLKVGKDKGFKTCFNHCDVKVETDTGCFTRKLLAYLPCIFFVDAKLVFLQ